MKTSLLAVVLLFSSCAAQSGPDPVEEQVSAAVIGGAFTRVAGWAQQVPGNALDTDYAGGYQSGTVSNYGAGCTAYLQNSSDGNPSHFYVSLQCGGTIYPDIYGGVNGALAGNYRAPSHYVNGWQQFFPDFWSFPGGPIQNGLVRVSAGNAGTSCISSTCIGNGQIYVYFWNASGGIGASGPDANTKNIAVRIDNFYPNYGPWPGVTNRYFMQFAR